MWRCLSSSALGLSYLFFLWEISPSFCCSSGTSLSQCLQHLPKSCIYFLHITCHFVFFQCLGNFLDSLSQFSFWIFCLLLCATCSIQESQADECQAGCWNWRLCSHCTCFPNSVTCVLPQTRCHFGQQGTEIYSERKGKKSLQRILSFDVLRIFSHKRKHLPLPRNYFKPEEVETTLIVKLTFLVEMRLKNKGKAHLETSITI